MVDYIFLGILVVFLLCGPVNGDCAMQKNCNGHGLCIESTSKCACFSGYGASSDITFYRAADCSARTCPAGKAWADVPASNIVAHQLVECSNRGICNRETGECTCFPGFTGASCNRNACPNACSGHGQCVSIKQMAQMSNALPLGANTYYEGDEDFSTWDEDMTYGCVCDSSWEVGLGSGEKQQPEWFGADCSLRHCPSGDDPRTTSTDETDCYNVTAAGSSNRGESGNLCHVDCANRGLCNYKTGLCSCFDGYIGENCATINTLSFHRPNLPEPEF